jgi:mevalonate kinase
MNFPLISRKKYEQELGELKKKNDELLEANAIFAVKLRRIMNLLGKLKATVPMSNVRFIQNVKDVFEK